MRGLTLATLGALAACDSLFNLETVQVPGTADASGGTGERPAFCTSAALLDTFDTSVPCAFGSLSGADRVTQHDSVFDIAFPANEGQGFAGCTIYRELPLTDAGVFTQVTRHFELEPGYTVLTVRNHHETSPAVTTKIVFIDGALNFEVDDEVIGSRPDIPPWWRIRRPAGTASLVGEVSVDGTTWEQLGAVDIDTFPPAFSVDFGAGLNGDVPAAVQATFTVFGVCE